MTESLSEPKMVNLHMHICITQPQLINPSGAECRIFTENKANFTASIFWWPGSWCRQVISSHGIDYAEPLVLKTAGYHWICITLRSRQYYSTRARLGCVAPLGRPRAVYMNSVECCFFSRNGQMTLKVKVNASYFQYQLRESQDAYLMQIWWF